MNPVYSILRLNPALLSLTCFSRLFLLLFYSQLQYWFHCNVCLRSLFELLHQSQVFGAVKQAVLNNMLVFGSFQSSLYPRTSSSCLCWKACGQYAAVTAILQSIDGDKLRLLSGRRGLTSWLISSNIHLISAHNVLPSALAQDILQLPGCCHKSLFSAKRQISVSLTRVPSSEICHYSCFIRF